MKEKNLVNNFVDNGNTFTVTAESKDDIVINLGNRPYKLQSPYDNQYKKVKRKGVFTSDIGVKSSGFAPIFTLALIIAFGSAIIAYLLWRF